ncbi:hypothetical protein [Candidatus Laterigemmans baculatus]|uniref:hypothetical protein n=1 Tax=Candidatus Laterigemmans baculatus TaxID=2770505 RepID=UPI0013DD7403|nr:hypothetical protein [Candidatus Laterigemmans baculatus]
MRPQPTRCRIFLSLALLCGVPAVGGCGSLLYRLTSPVPPAFIPNPVVLPPAEPEFVWSQVIDTVDDYFRVVREQPLQASREIVLEGRVETAYRTGASLFEPWRKDSTKGFERLQSTLQSIRRRAIITVRPEAGGYTVAVQVDKEIEDVDHEQFASEGAITSRQDGSVEQTGDFLEAEPKTLGWISLGRDVTLEQQILQEIVSRVTEPDRPKLLHH